jgi:hypothetical protein
MILLLAREITVMELLDNASTKRVTPCAMMEMTAQLIAALPMDVNSFVMNTCALVISVQTRTVMMELNAHKTLATLQLENANTSKSTVCAIKVTSAPLELAHQVDANM